MHRLFLFNANTTQQFNRLIPTPPTVSDRITRLMIRLGTPQRLIGFVQRESMTEDDEESQEVDLPIKLDSLAISGTWCDLEDDSRSVMPAVEAPDERCSSLLDIISIGPWHKQHPLCRTLQGTIPEAQEGVWKVLETTDEAAFTQPMREHRQALFDKYPEHPELFYTMNLNYQYAGLLSMVLSTDLPPLSLGELLEHDRSTIQKKIHAPEIYEGTLLKNAKKAGAIVSIFYPNAYNFPSEVGILSMGEGHAVHILRHPVPTRESFTSIEIIDEYKTLLTKCQTNGKKLLYISLLNPKARDEKARIDVISSLAAEYPGTFSFMRLPLDGPICTSVSTQSTEEYKKTIINHLRASLAGTETTFIFSEDLTEIIGSQYQKIMDWAHEEVARRYSPEESEIANKVLLMLFCYGLKIQILSSQGISYYNNTCKDAIDRGAAHLTADLLIGSLLAGKLPEHRGAIRMLTAAPAFVAKSQGVLKDRLAYAIAVSDFCHRIGADPSFKARFVETFGISSCNLNFHDLQEGTPIS